MKILYWGPITPEGKPNKGGYEAANRKNINALRRNGVEVEEYPYPIVNRKLGPLGKLVYAKLFFTPLRWLRYRGRKDMVVHSTPLYGTLTLPALWGLKIARLAGLHTLTDIRAGSLPHYWATKGKGYRRMISSLLKKSDTVTVEGLSYIDFMRSKIGLEKDAVYFPNVDNVSPVRMSESKSFPDSEGKINVFYFGRITKAKGIDTILEARKHLPSDYRIYLAGPIAADIAPDSIHTDGIEYLGLLTPAELEATMKKMHFFIFPTRHIGEGQSNSLIEAMSNGLVPVTSRQGFCSDVVANCGRTLPAEATGEDYARAIIEMSGRDFDERSAQCRQHIAENHNMDIEIFKLIKLYNDLCI